VDETIEQLNREVDLHLSQTQQHAVEISELKAGQARLEVSVAGLGEKVNSGFQTLNSTLTTMNTKTPTPWVGVASLCISVLVVFGAIISFTFGIITQNMQRETDLRFSYIEARETEMMTQIKSQLTSREAMLDELAQVVGEIQSRELQDSFDKGFATAKFEDLDHEFKHLDDGLHRRHDRTDDRLLRLFERMSSAETGMRATGDYVSEHTSKPGGQGHPKSERVIRSEGSFGVQQLNPPE
jgi:hypothetical protein